MYSGNNLDSTLDPELKKPAEHSVQLYPLQTSQFGREQSDVAVSETKQINMTLTAIPKDSALPTKALVKGKVFHKLWFIFYRWN